jgi:hypothetical protein
LHRDREAIADCNTALVRGDINPLWVYRLKANIHLDQKRTDLAYMDFTRAYYHAAGHWVPPHCTNDPKDPQEEIGAYFPEFAAHETRIPTARHDNSTQIAHMIQSLLNLSDVPNTNEASKIAQTPMRDFSKPGAVVTEIGQNACFTFTLEYCPSQAPKVTIKINRDNCTISQADLEKTLGIGLTKRADHYYVIERPGAGMDLFFDPYDFHALDLIQCGWLKSDQRFFDHLNSTQDTRAPE